MTVQVIIILITLLSVLSTHKACEMYKDTLGVTSPSHDIFLRNGTSLALKCTLYPHNFPTFFPPFISSKNIVFLKDGTKLVPQSLVHVLNNSTAELRIDNVSEGDGGFYKCFIHLPKSKERIGAVQDAYVCGNLVKVGESKSLYDTPSAVPPQLIKNDDFKCISLNWRNMTCTWKQPPNQIPTTYYLSYSFPMQGHRRSREFKCPTYKSKNSCFFGSDVKKQRVVYKQSAKYFIFRLKGENELGISSGWYLLEHFSVVIPNRPQDVRVAKVDTHSLFLEWKSPLENDLFPPGLDYEVKYRSEWDEADDWKITRTRKEKIEITSLIPHTWYYIKLRCKSRIAEEKAKWWSTFSTIKVITDSDVNTDPQKLLSTEEPAFSFVAAQVFKEAQYAPAIVESVAKYAREHKEYLLILWRNFLPLLAEAFDNQKGHIFGFGKNPERHGEKYRVDKLPATALAGVPTETILEKKDL
ncbi:prolactin receptor [Nymphon striatum]|nr:prolactin receptor [Nymphon striatum]